MEKMTKHPRWVLLNTAAPAALVESDDMGYLLRLADDYCLNIGHHCSVRLWTGCEYFLACANAAAGTTEHPVLAPVPTCERCARMFELQILPFSDQPE